MRAYDRAIRKLSQADRDVVLEAVEAENRISDLLSGACDCTTLDGLPKVVREPVVSLFTFAFDLLTKLGIRDEQYAAIHAAVPESLCPFCGTEYFDAPGAPREAMDHYLTRSRYPFAAANLRNLVPMGGKCNSKYKLAIDLIRCADGSRRAAFDPYNHATLSISLDLSEPFGGAPEGIPRWEIRFYPESSAVPTWDEVFRIRERYRRDHLDREFMGWLRQFRAFTRRARMKTTTKSALVAALRRYGATITRCVKG